MQSVGARTSCVLTALTALTALAGCGGEACPAGSVRMGDRCVAAGTDAGSDAGLPDADAGAPPRDAGADGSVACSTVFRDSDHDGHGDPATGTSSCGAPAGYVSVGDDCDDACPTCLPGGTETCDGRDNDCDGTPDQGLATSTFYRDADGDGFGDSAMSRDVCAAPTGFVATSGDCNDGAASVYPGATETCNGVDDDCDGTPDDGLLGPLDARVRLGSVSSAAPLSLAATSSGYFSVVSGSYQRLDATGATVSGIAQPLGTSASASAAAVAIIDVGGTEHAAAVWGSSAGTVRARFFPLDGRAPLAEQTLSGMETVGPSRAMLATSGGAIVAAWESGGFPYNLYGRLLDPATGAPAAATTSLYARTVPAFDASWGALAGLPGTTPELLVAGRDRAGSDTDVVVYADRVTTMPTLRSEGMRGRADPGATGGVLGVHAVALREGGRVMLLAQTLDRLYAAMATPRAGMAPSIDAFVDRGAMHVGGAVAAPGVVDAVVTIVDAGGIHVALDELQTSGSASTPVTLQSIASTERVDSAAIARRTASDGAIVYTFYASTSATTGDVYFQRFGCR